MDAFKIGDRVANYPLGLGRTDLVVEGVVAEILSDGSPVIAANFRGEYVRFVADAAKCEAVQ